MRNPQSHGSKEEPVSAVPGRTARIRVPGIPDKAMADRAEMHAKLVRSTGQWLCKHGRRGTGPRQLSDGVRFANCMRMFAIYP